MIQESAMSYLDSNTGTVTESPTSNPSNDNTESPTSHENPDNRNNDDPDWLSRMQSQ